MNRASKRGSTSQNNMDCPKYRVMGYFANGKKVFIHGFNNKKYAVDEARKVRGSVYPKVSIEDPSDKTLYLWEGLIERFSFSGTLDSTKWRY